MKWLLIKYFLPNDTWQNPDLNYETKLIKFMKLPIEHIKR